MNNKIIFLSAILFSAVMSAQVKIGGTDGTPNANAMLEVESTTKGVLLPRVALTSTAAFAPLTAHVAGMTVYNTATAGDVTPGQYYNDGTKWNRIVNSSEVPAGVVVTANNGLTKTGDNIALGGNLTASTTVTTTAANDLTIATTAAGTTGKLKVTGLAATTAVQLPTDKIIVQDAAGVLKTANVSDFAKTRNTTVYKAKIGNGNGILSLNLLQGDQNVNFSGSTNTFHNGTVSPIDSNGDFTIQESGVYSVGYYFRYGEGVQLSALDLLNGGFAGIKILRNGTEMDIKNFSGANIGLGNLVQGLGIVSGLLNLGVLNIVISSSEINTIYQFNAGDVISFRTRLGGLANLSLLSDREATLHIYKISDL